MASPSTTERIFKTIDFILACKDGAGFSYLQSELNIPKSSMHSILKELCNLGILYYNDKTKVYTAGSSFVELSARCMAQVNLVREINIVASTLSAKAKTTVSASIRHERQITYIVEQAERAGSRITNVGLTFPAHATAMGKVLLSSLSDVELKKLYDSYVFETYTEHTIKNLDELLASIKQTRMRGYSTDMGEFAPTLGCISVPIRFAGKTIAAMSITTNISRLNEDFIKEKLVMLYNASDEIVRRMGGGYIEVPFR